MNEPLFDNLAEVGRRVDAAPSVDLFLDFDGTLAPLMDRPEHVQLAPEVRQALLRLQALPDVVVAVVSGRALADVQERVGIPGIYCAGNHGLEIHGPDCAFLETSAIEQRRC